MAIGLNEHFTYKKIFRITLSPILMMLFTSLYTVVDGICISNFDGPVAFAGVNLIWPVLMIVGGIGFMFGTGGSALASKRLGEQRIEDANRVFTNITISTAIVGIVMSILGIILIRPITEAMGSITEGANQDMVEEAINYGRILMAGMALFMLQNMFQNFFVVDEKPKLGFLFTFLAGVTNIVLDLLFIGLFKWGTTGAALATLIGYIVGAVGPIIHFITHKNGNITLVKCKPDFRSIGQSCFNGISEFVSNIAISAANLVINLELLKYFNQDGINAYGIIQYVVLIFLAIFIGYCIGFAPVISYNFGAQNIDELQNCTKKSVVIISITCLAMFILGEVLATPIALIFSQGDQNLIDLTTHAFRIYSICFLFCGMSMFISSFFTALNNGVLSGIVSILRLFVFQFAAIIFVPLIMGGDGVWWSIPIAEGASILCCFIFLMAVEKKYHYWRKTKKVN